MTAADEKLVCWLIIGFIVLMTLGIRNLDQPQLPPKGVDYAWSH